MIPGPAMRHIGMEALPTQSDHGTAFAAITERHRAELQLHCYRMLGSLQDAEDAVQDTLMRAWVKRDGFQGRSTPRAWLYAIATNACLDMLRKRRRRLLPPDIAEPADPFVRPAAQDDTPWLEPYPDRLLDNLVADGLEPEAWAIGRETIELAFIAAIQHLPPRQRAVLILRDVLDWSAREVAASMDATVASVNSALQRARATLGERRLHRDESTAAGHKRYQQLSETERSLARGLITAWENADADAVAALLSANALMVMPPTRSWYAGRAAIRTFCAEQAFSAELGRTYRLVESAANRQPAAAMYFRERGRPDFEAAGLLVMRIEGRSITELTLFRQPSLVAACGLPPRQHPYAEARAGATPLRDHLRYNS